MKIDELIEMAEKEGMISVAKYVNKNFERGEAAILMASIQNVLNKESNFLKIDISEGDYKKPMVHCPLFDKDVHIDETCYGCRFNPGTGRFEGKDGEFFQCNYNPATDVPAGPATRTIQPPTKTSSDIEKESAKKKCRHMNPDNTFKGGFDGCVEHFRECKGLKKENAEKLCAYINRRKSATEEEIIKSADIEKESQQEEIVEEKVTLPDEEELSRFDGMSDDELHAQLQMYRELQKILQDAPAGTNIKVQDTIQIIEYIENLLNSQEGVTPSEIEESPEGAVIEEVPAEEVDEVMLEMERAASLVKDAPDILDRCVRKVLKQHEGEAGFGKSNAYAICIDTLRDKYPSVEEWVHKKKSEVLAMKEIEELDMSQLTVSELEERLAALNECEFVVRSCMNVNNDAAVAEGSRVLKKIIDEKAKIKELVSVQLPPAKEVTPQDYFQYDADVVKEIPHALADEFRKVAKQQNEFDWDTFIEVIPKLIVEQNEALQPYKELMAERARQILFPKISALSPDRQQYAYLVFMDAVEKERKLAMGEKIEEEPEEKIEKEASVKEEPDPRQLFI